MYGGENGYQVRLEKFGLGVWFVCIEFNYDGK